MKINPNIVTGGVSVALRYSAIGIQFLLVLVITSQASLEIAGIYFMILGWINATYFLAGFGLPDGIVAEVPLRKLKYGNDSARSLIKRTSVTFAISIALPLTFCVAVALVLGISMALVISVAFWWLAYAITFFCAQALLSLGRPAIGSFFFYPAINLSLVFSLLPYLVTTSTPSLLGMVATASAGSAVMALAGSLILATELTGASDGKTVPVDTATIIKLGFPLALSRAAKTALYWTPVWAAGAALSPSAAAVMALASRLSVATAAAITAIRFVIRPSLVRSMAARDWSRIELNARLISTAATISIGIAIVIYLLVGKELLNFVFPPEYEAAYLPLAVLLLAILAESVGGVVDEILKLAGHAYLVLTALVVVAIVEIGLCWLLGKYGLFALSAIQTGSFALLFGFMIWQARKLLNVETVPYFRLDSLKAAWATMKSE